MFKEDYDIQFWHLVFSHWKSILRSVLGRFIMKTSEVSGKDIKITPKHHNLLIAQLTCD